MRTVMLLAAGLALAAPAVARAQCAEALSPPAQLDPGNALELYRAGMAAMRDDRMPEADRLLRSSFARLSESPPAAAAALEPMVIARLVELAIQRNEPQIGVYRLKVLRERLRGRSDFPDWVNQVMKQADLATLDQQNSLAGTDEAGACRSFGVAVRSAARINFYTGSAAVDSAARAGFARIASNLLSSGTARTIVRGHTDARGSDAYNDALSLRRAEAVIALLTALEPRLAGRLVAAGAGKHEPLYPGEDEDSYRLNRRVEFVPAEAP